MLELKYRLTFIEHFICAWHFSKDFMDITAFILMNTLNNTYVIIVGLFSLE